MVIEHELGSIVYWNYQPWTALCDHLAVPSREQWQMRIALLFRTLAKIQWDVRVGSWREEGRKSSVDYPTTDTVNCEQLSDGVSPGRLAIYQDQQPAES